MIGRGQTLSLRELAHHQGQTGEQEKYQQRIKNIKQRHIVKLYIPGANKTLEAERRGLCVGRHLAARSKEDCLRWRSS